MADAQDQAATQARLDANPQVQEAVHHLSEVKSFLARLRTSRTLGDPHGRLLADAQRLGFSSVPTYTPELDSALDSKASADVVRAVKDSGIQIDNDFILRPFGAQLGENVGFPWKSVLLSAAGFAGGVGVLGAAGGGAGAAGGAGGATGAATAGGAGASTAIPASTAAILPGTGVGLSAAGTGAAGAGAAAPTAASFLSPTAPAADTILGAATTTNAGVPLAAGTGSSILGTAKNLAPILGQAAGSRAQAQQASDQQALANANYALRAPGVRLGTGLRASMVENFRPSTADWGGPGSGLRGQTVNFHTPFNNPDVYNNPDLHQLAQDTLHKQLLASLNNQDQLRDPSDSSALDKALGYGATGAAILGAFSR